MLVPWFFLVLGLVIITLGAEALVRGSASLALRLGIPSLVVGLTVVAYGTSAPELLVTTQASLAGRGGIAAGNVLGSNIFNVAVILALTALLNPIRVHRQAIRIEAPLVLAVSLLLIPVLANGEVERHEAILLAMGAVVYTCLQVILAKRKAEGTVVAEDSGPDRSTEAGQGGAFIVAGMLALMAVGIGGLVLGAKLMVDNAVLLAQHFGVSEALIGLTIISVGTSLPELATCVVAAVRKHSDIALGNILGSNLFNILLIVGVSGTVRPYVAEGVTSLDVAYMVGLAVVLPVFLLTKRTLERWEGVLLLASYGGYLYLIWPK